MRRFYASAAVWATLSLVCFDPDQVFAASPAGATDEPQNTVPQGTDPPGADNGDQPSSPPLQHKGVIEPPPIGDEDIFTQAPNPHAGHDEEVIPPPAEND